MVVVVLALEEVEVEEVEDKNYSDMNSTYEVSTANCAYDALPWVLWNYCMQMVHSEKIRDCENSCMDLAHSWSALLPDKYSILE